MNLSIEDLFTPIDEQTADFQKAAIYLKPSVWMLFKQNRAGLCGLVLFSLIVFLAITVPLLSQHSYETTNLRLKNLPPSADFWFGTDDLGRDIFTRTWYGARISLFIGLTAASIDFLIGIVWGGVAALAGGKIDEGLMRLADILYALPYLLVVILLNVMLGSGLWSMIIAITLIGWITMARVVRGQLLLLKEMEYVLAARAIGASFGRILFKHLLPNAMGPILVTITLTVPAAIFTEAFLSFMGLGVQAPMASWGTMTSEGLSALAYYPWRLFFPAFFISLTLLSLQLVGEALKQAFIPVQSSGYL